MFWLTQATVAGIGPHSAACGQADESVKSIDQRPTDLLTGQIGFPRMKNTAHERATPRKLHPSGRTYRVRVVTSSPCGHSEPETVEPPPKQKLPEKMRALAVGLRKPVCTKIRSAPCKWQPRPVSDAAC